MFLLHVIKRLRPSKSPFSRIRSSRLVFITLGEELRTVQFAHKQRNVGFREHR